MDNTSTTYVVIANTNVEVPPESEIRRTLEPYKVILSTEQIAQIQSYIGLLVFWNQKISLTSIEDLQEIVARHFGESFFCGQFVGSGKSRLADVGSGAGFPGLALKISRPELQVFLIEQDTRKSTFLHEVIRLLKLDGVRVHRVPYEGLPLEIAEFDTITARAIGNHKALLKWARPRLSVRGQVILLLGAEDATRASQVKGWDWLLPHPIPNSKRRVILVGTPQK